MCIRVVWGACVVVEGVVAVRQRKGVGGACWAIDSSCRPRSVKCDAGTRSADGDLVLLLVLVANDGDHTVARQKARLVPTDDKRGQHLTECSAIRCQPCVQLP